MAAMIKDVAKFAGTSASTVSHVLSNRLATIRVSEATRRRVLDAANTLGYRPNPMAQSLRTRKTGTIGVVVRAMRESARRLEYLQILASALDYHLLLAICGPEAGRQDHEIGRLLLHHVDGLLLLSPSLEPGKHDLLASLVKRNFPIIGIGPALTDGADRIDWDRPRAYHEITEHLVKRGCRRFVFLGEGKTPGILQRVEGIQQVLTGMAGAKLRLVGRGLGETVSVESHLRDRWADAVICATDKQAAEVIQLAASLGLRVPDELAVTGCSDLEFGALLSVPLTTVRMPDEKLAEAALSRLITRIKEPKETWPPTVTILPTDLVIRKSSLFRGPP